MNDEYRRRINLCSKAVANVSAKLGLEYGFAEDYQGIEIKVGTEVGDGMVVVLMDTGYGPRFPRYIKLTVHGVVHHEINSKVYIGGGGFARSENIFLPDNISQKWLLEAISKAAECVKTICSTQNMERLKKEALALRRQKIKESKLARHQATVLTATLPINT